MPNGLDFADLQTLSAEILRVKPERIQMNVSLARDLGADSLDTLEVMAAVEDRWHVRLTEQTLREMSNVGDLWAYLQEHSPELQPTA